MKPKKEVCLEFLLANRAGFQGFSEATSLCIS